MSTIPTNFTRYGHAPIVTRQDPDDAPAPDATSDAAGFVMRAAKEQAAFFSKLRVNEETLVEIEGDMAWIEMPRVRVGVPLRMCQFADQVAGWVADEADQFYAALFRELKS